MTPEQKLANVSQSIQQGMDFHRQGRLSEATTCYSSALALDPRQPDALHMLGVLKLQQGKAEDAIELIGAAARFKPGAVDILSNLAAAQIGAQRFADALATYNKLLASTAPSADLYQAHGFVLYHLGRLEDAIASFDRALALVRDHGPALFNRGNLLAALGRFEEALASYDLMLVKNSTHLDAWNNRGNILSQLSRFEEALASYEKALSIKPGHLDALSNRGNVLRKLNRHEEAMASYDHALAISPNHFNALYNKSNALVHMKRHEEAVELLKKATVLAPHDAKTANLLAICYLATCAWNDAASVFQRLKAYVQAGQPVEPFTFLSYGAPPPEQLACARTYLRSKVAEALKPAHRAPRVRPDKLRIAYLSSDLRQHPVGYAIAPLLEQHDRAAFEIFGISLSGDDGSALRRRIVKACDHFHDVSALSDRDALRRLQQLDVDVVVDLNGHTDGARQEILAMRIAPVQVSYLGFAGTSGAKFIDYILGDETVLGGDQHLSYSEKIVHLPDTFFPCDPDQPIGDRPQTRIEAGLPENAFVFCCFNNSYKLSAASFASWMRLMSKIGGSVLWLSNVNELAKANLQQAAAGQGIDPARLIFAPRLERREDHLARHRFADIFLDTLPFNAHATAADALVAGLPVLTCAGKTFAGRVAASLVQAAGLDELATESPEAYETMALKLAGDPVFLQSIRRKLAGNRASAPFFSPARLCRHIEAAYATMWDIRSRGENPRGFTVPAQSS